MNSRAFNLRTRPWHQWEWKQELSVQWKDLQVWQQLLEQKLGVSEKSELVWRDQVKILWVTVTGSDQKQKKKWSGLWGLYVDSSVLCYLHNIPVHQ